MIAVGVGVASVYTEYEVFLSTKFFSVPTLLLVIGTFIILFSVFGCWGAYKENHVQILIFTILLAIIFILELAAGISGYVLRSNAEDLLRHSLNNTMMHYNKATPNEATVLWDYLQRSVNNKYTELICTVRRTPPSPQSA